MKIDPPFELDPNVKVRTRFAPSPTGYLHVVAHVQPFILGYLQNIITASLYYVLKILT